MNYDDIINNPRYQKAIAKWNTLPPDKKAIFNTAMLDAGFADENMRQKIRAIQMAGAQKSRQENLALSKKAFEDLKETRDDALGYQKKQYAPALGLGLANLGVSAYAGKKQMDLKNMLAASIWQNAALYNTPSNYRRDGRH